MREHEDTLSRRRRGPAMPALLRRDQCWWQHSLYRHWVRHRNAFGIGIKILMKPRPLFDTIQVSTSPL
ncbi:MAG: hypothetical protein ACLTDS_14885 [Bianqueaceae bacterium]